MYKIQGEKKKTNILNELLLSYSSVTRDLLGGSDGEESAYKCRRPEFDPWVRKIPCRKDWLPTLVFLLGEFLGQRILVGYSPWGHKELDMTEPLTDTESVFRRLSNQIGIPRKEIRSFQKTNKRYN